jgi:uncharacterized paraquat-inducible protein A
VNDDTSTYCPGCGSKLAPPAKEADPEGEMVEMQQLMLAGLAGMAIFFSFGFFLAGTLAEPGLLTVAVVLLIAGLAMLGARAMILRRHRRRVERRRAEEHVKCEYCGGTNHRGDHRCEFCGAPLW